MEQPTQRTVVTRFLLVALAAPAVIVAAAVALTLSWQADVPDPIAVHWGASGGPDGFGSLAAAVWLMAATAFGVPALMALALAPYLRRGGRGATLRLLGGIALSMSVLYTVLLTWSVAAQRGLTDAAAGPEIWWPLGGAFAAGIAAGFAGYFAQPEQHSPAATVVVGDPINLRDGEHVAWIRAARGAQWLGALGAVVTALLAAGTALLWLTGAAEGAWLLGGSTVLVGALFAAMSAFVVRVDDSGVSIRSQLGWPTLRAPLADIESAVATTVQGFGEFGGYGVRMNSDATGVILTNGEALRVQRTSGRALMVTVDDAATAASLVNALVARRDAKRA